MLRIVLIRPGSTDFDEQGRIKGTLEIPLNERGASQVARTIQDVAGLSIEVIYTSPCQAAEQTAEAMADALGVRVKKVDKLENLDHGLWHGKLIEEVRQCQPKVYRQMQDHPETVCPPEGEPLVDACRRVGGALDKLLKRHDSGTIALVLPEPVYSMVRAHLQRGEIGDLWKAECQCGSWQVIQVGSEKALVSG